jgi:hypothetical protein
MGYFIVQKHDAQAKLKKHFPQQSDLYSRFHSVEQMLLGVSG